MPWLSSLSSAARRSAERWASLADILDRPVILKLDSLGNETDRALFTRAFLLWLYYRRLAEGKSAGSKHVLLIEEAHQLFLRRADEGQSVHDLMLRQMRDLGEALVLLDQNPSLLSTPALGNTGTTVCLNLKHADDVEAAGKTLTLPKENWDDIGRLPVGHGIVKVQGRWPKPFLVRFPCFPVPTPVVPSQADGSAPRADSVHRSVEELRSALDEAIRAIQETGRRTEEDQEIGARERNLLLDIAGHPLSVIGGDSRGRSAPDRPIARASEGLGYRMSAATWPAGPREVSSPDAGGWC